MNGASEYNDSEKGDSKDLVFSFIVFCFALIQLLCLDQTIAISVENEYQIPTIISCLFSKVVSISTYFHYYWRKG